MAYELYPAVDENHNFPPEIRAKLAVSPELRNTIVPMTESARNNLTGADLWDGRFVLNTTTDRVNRYDLDSLSWAVLVEQTDITAGISSATPIGAIIAFAGAAAPVGWHLCDGTVHNSAALTTVLTLGGHANPDKTPNLKDKFILGDGGSQPTSGGEAEVTLSAVQSGIRAHAHPAATTGNNSVGHTHTVDPPNTYSSETNTDHLHYVSLGGGAHGHNSSYGNNFQLSAQDQNLAGDRAGPIANTPERLESLFSDGAHGHAGNSNLSDRAQSHGHYVNIAAFASQGESAAHTHSFTPTSNTDGPATAAHNNMPPYYALTYIIKTT